MALLTGGKNGSFLGMGMGQHSGCMVFLELQDLQSNSESPAPIYIGVKVKSWSRNLDLKETNNENYRICMSLW